jgi:hypothetical protein
MTNPTDPTDVPDDLQQAIARLPRERPARAGLEDVVVQALRVAGELPGDGRPRARPRTGRRVGALALGAAAALAVALLRPWSHSPPAATPGASYMLLLYEDSAYRAPGPGQEGERVAEYRQWADSLRGVGRLERAAELDGAGPVTGFFIVRAETEAEAARLARACPHVKYGGRVEVRRLID